MATFFTNPDGLTQRYGQLTTSDAPVVRSSEYNIGGTVVVDFDFNHLLNASGVLAFWTEDAGGGSTVDSPSSLNAAIPSGAWIKSATLFVKTAFVGATGTLTIGLYDKAGTAIDADGIDAAIAVTAIDAVGDVVLCNGALVGGLVTGVSSLTTDSGMYIGALSATANFTAGAARLVVEYIHAPR